MTKLVIIGGGPVGQFLAHNDELFGLNVERVGILDDDPGKHGRDFSGWRVLGSISLFAEVARTVGDLSVAIGIANPATKRRVVEQLRPYAVRYPALVARNVWLSRQASVDDGAIIYPGVVINHGAKVGRHALINLNCAIGHDVSLGPYCFLAPGVNLGGCSVLEECVEMGIGAATKQGILVGRGAIVGGMSMVTREVASGSVVYGVPARERRGARHGG